MSPRITIDQDQLAAFCLRNHIRRLALFGSVLRPDFRPDSAVDVLVENEAGTPIGLFEMARMERDLSEMLGRKVDLRTLEELSRYFRQEVLDAAEVQFAQGG
ncbi:MAG TPA: nucleotidyltransferase domain-containing protein [Pantanalinema sp.]